MINNENVEITRLWMMPRVEFNEWRRKNDLPVLLEFFKNTLPAFPDWQNSYGLEDEKLLAVDRPSMFFLGDTDIYLASTTGPDENGRNQETRTSIFQRNPKEAEGVKSFLPPDIRFSINWSQQFRPYFFWLKSIKRMRKFPIPGDRNNQLVDNLEYRSWAGADYRYSRASLFYSHKVLKLGGVRITPWQLDHRNLDFVDLDGLLVTGDGWDRSTHVGYSSCRGLHLIKTDKAFLTFERCQVEELSVESSRLQDLHFIDCELWRPSFRKSRLFKTSFVRTFPAGIDIEKCELREFELSAPPRKVSHAGLSEFFGRVRAAFQERGDRRETANYYYRERYHELLASLIPVVPNLPNLPKRRYSENLSDLCELWQRKEISSAKIVNILGQDLVFYLKVFLLPNYLARLLVSKKRLIPDFADWVIWGFGEKPGRVFLFMVLVVAIFAGRYFLSDNSALEGRLLDSIYCSTLNFSTMGCEYKRGIDSIEGLLGATLVGIMVAGFANRTRY